MEFLKNWIMGICGCTVLISLISSLMPKSNVARVVRVCGTAILVFAVFAPLKQMQSNDFEFPIVSEAHEVVAENHEHIEISFIENRITEYVLQRANELGVECEVNVHVTRNENGVLLPQKIELCGIGVTNKLVRAIEHECGVKPIVTNREMRTKDAEKT